MSDEHRWLATLIPIAQNHAQVVVYDAFVHMMNPKYRGPNWKWDNFEDFVVRQAKVSAYHSFALADWELFEKEILETVERTARLSAQTVLADSGVLEWTHDKDLEAIRSALLHGSDDWIWPSGLTIPEAIERLVRQSYRLQAILQRGELVADKTEAKLTEEEQKGLVGRLFYARKMDHMMKVITAASPIGDFTGPLVFLVSLYRLDRTPREMECEMSYEEMLEEYNLDFPASHECEP